MAVAYMHLEKLFIGVCNKRSGLSFQEFFEDVMKMIDSDFLAISSAGDKNSDGMLGYADTIFAVYSPKQIMRRRKEQTIEQVQI